MTPYPPATAIASIAVDVPAGTQVLRVTWDSGALQSAANTPALYELQTSADGGTTWSPASSWLYSQQRAQEQFVWGYGQGVPPGWTGGAISQGSFMPATEYRFRLRRTRYAPGTSLQILPATAWVATSAGVTTPAAGAGAPRGISAEPLSTGAAVSWIAPQFSGSSAITSYKVYVLAVGASPSGATPSATVSASDTASTIFRISDSVGYDVKRAVISGLVNGQQYAVWIGAVNSTGETIAAGPLVTPSAAVLGQFASFVAEPKAAGCTHPDGAAWGEMALRVSRAEYVAWGSGVTIEAQYQRAGSLSADWMVWSGGNVSSGPVNPQFFDPKWFNAVNPGSWYWKPDGSNETTATHVQTVIEEGPTLGSRGPNLTTGVDYVFRARPVKGTVVGPWSYSTAKTNCRYA